jgi:hypothetical protein
VKKLDQLFDPKEFAVAFGAAIGESSSEWPTCRTQVSARSDSDAASAGAGDSLEGDQKAVHDSSYSRRVACPRQI